MSPVRTENGRKRKLNNSNTRAIKKQRTNEQKDDNPWSEILNSKEEYMPQFIQCDDCDKWRIVNVLTKYIAVWKPPSGWKCINNMNGQVNKCSTAQHVLSNYSHTQKKALSIQRKLIIQNNEKKASNHDSTNESNIKHKDGINQDLQKENQILKKQNEEMTKTLNVLQGKSREIDTLSLVELNTFESLFANGINRVIKARERLMEDTLYCIICVHNKKNVVIQKCGHYDMCSVCEKNMPSKRCPRCLQSFEHITIINH